MTKILNERPSNVRSVKHYISMVVGCVIAGAMTLAPNRVNLHAQEDVTWKLAWSDEFDGKEIDRSKWDRDLGNGFNDYEAKQWVAGWGNGELQYYTREPDNAFLKDGMLHVRAIKERGRG